MNKRTTCTKAIVYILLSCFFALVMAGAALLDMKTDFGIHIFDLIAKVIIIAGILVYATRQGVPMNAPGSRILTPWLAMALIPALANTISTFCIPNHFPGTVETFNLTAVMLTTALWEEMYFRYMGRTLFEKKGKYTISSVLLLSITFAIPHLINIFFHDPISVLIQVLSAVISGIFWLALYRHTGSLWLTITGHFLQNFLGTFFQAFTTAEFFAEQTAQRPSLLLMILCCVIQLAAGLYILKKFKYITG